MLVKQEWTGEIKNWELSTVYAVILLVDVFESIDRFGPGSNGIRRCLTSVIFVHPNVC